MPKVNKIYGSFYNGISEQVPELIHETNCVDMVNVIPDIVVGATKRPPVSYVTSNTTMSTDSRIIHSYDRGEDDEEYIFVGTGDANAPLAIYDKDGTPKTLTYDDDDIKTYLSDVETVTSLKGLTVQDRTFIINKEEVVTQATVETIDTIPTAYYWLKRSSADENNEFRYAVYLSGSIFETTDKDSDKAAAELAALINAYPLYTAEVLGTSTSAGNVLKITSWNNRMDFSFHSWDSWGSQASFGWKGSVSKLSDLPVDIGWDDIYVEITGDDKNDFTDYWVKSSGSSWVETKDPSDTRGSLTNMPIAIDRQSDGTFLASFLDWEAPAVGDADTNPDPSFLGHTINDMFFYKNRLGLVSTDSVVLSETGGYYNFYIKTTLDIIDTDPIDVSMASTTASQIQYAIPFQGSLFLFTKEGQFEMASQGATTPLTVSIEAVSSYPMAIEVEPKVSGNSLFFISLSSNKQQLREYRKNNETLNVAGIDLNLTTPTLLNIPIKQIFVSGVLGYVFLTSDTNEVFVYSYKDNSEERIQSAWSRWLLYEGYDDIVDNSFEYRILSNKLVVVYRTDTDYVYSTMVLAKEQFTLSVTPPLYASENLYPSTTLYPSGVAFSDTSKTDTHTYKSLIELPQWYPKMDFNIKTPKNKILLKKVTIEGEGSFDANTYRSDYNKTYSKTHDYTTIQDLDLHVNTRVGDCTITISDETTADFKITSFVFEGLYNMTSKRIS